MSFRYTCKCWYLTRIQKVVSVNVLDKQIPVTKLRVTYANFRVVFVRMNTVHFVVEI